jgi:hypothetical protein
LTFLCVTDREFLDKLSHYQLLNEDSAAWNQLINNNTPLGNSGRWKPGESRTRTVITDLFRRRKNGVMVRVSGTHER